MTTTENTGDLQALLRRVRRLEEIETARGFFQEYAATMDDPTPESAAALFAEDAVLHTRKGDNVRRFTGREEIAGFYRAVFTAEPWDKRHFIVNPQAIWLGEGRVRIKSHFLFLGCADERSVLGWGTYDDTIAVQGDSACFTEKTMWLHVRTDLETGWSARALRRG